MVLRDDGPPVAGAARLLGTPVDYGGARAPARAVHEGRYGRLEPLDPARHGDSLWAGACEPGADATWDYLPFGPFAQRADFDAHIAFYAGAPDILYFAIVGRDAGRALGLCAYQNIVPDMGTIEIGHVWFPPSLQRSRIGTEAIWLLMRAAFDDCGYRRIVWKCNALNAPSRRAAMRYGFSLEGTFRKHVVWKGRNRDTAWYAILDDEWPAARRPIEAWLDPANFDAEGAQRRSVSELRAAFGEAA